MSNLHMPPPAERWVPNEGEMAFFRLGGDRSLSIRHGCITREKADGVIVPTNTECIVSGAADVVLQTVERSFGRSRVKQEVLDLLFNLHVEDPPARVPGTIVFDERLRAAVAELGTARISDSLQRLRISVPPGWDRVIFAFVRSQSRPPDFEETLTEATVSGAIRAGLGLAMDNKLRSLALVPFGTGFSEVTPEQSARYMIPAIRDLLQSESNTCLERIIIVESCTGSFERFSRAAKQLLK